MISPQWWWSPSNHSWNFSSRWPTSNVPAKQRFHFCRILIQIIPWVPDRVLAALWTVTNQDSISSTTLNISYIPSTHNSSLRLSTQWYFLAPKLQNLSTVLLQNNTIRSIRGARHTQDKLLYSFSLAVVKHWPEPTRGGKGFFNLNSHITIYGQWSQNRNSSRGHGGMRLTALSSRTHSRYFLIEPRTTFQEVVV